MLTIEPASFLFFRKVECIDSETRFRGEESLEDVEIIEASCYRALFEIEIMLFFRIYPLGVGGRYSMEKSEFAIICDFSLIFADCVSFGDICS